MFESQNLFLQYIYYSFHFLSSIDRSDEANKALSAAVQLHDTLVKAWALWGDYLEALFTRDPSHVEYGVYAITCYLHASRHQNESKSRKYLAKVCNGYCHTSCGLIEYLALRLMSKCKNQYENPK